MSQLFSNNADTTLAATLAIGATSAVLTDGSGLQSPTGDEYELLTIIAAGNVEIVKVTARTDNTVTIVRAQEGTTAREWSNGTRVYAGVTAGTLDGILTAASEISNNATGANSLALGASSLSAGANSVAVGVGASTPNNTAVAVGRQATTALNGVAVGNIANSLGGGVTIGASTYAGANCVALGLAADAAPPSSISIGHTSHTWRSGALGDGRDIAIGYDAWSYADYGVAIGGFAWVDESAAHGIAIGQTHVERTKTLQVGALPVVPRSIVTGSDADAIWQSVGSQCIVMTAAKDLKTLASYVLTLPTGTTFFLDEVGVIVTSASGVTGQPTVRFGITGAEAQYLAATATTELEAVGDRQRFATLLTDKGAKTLRAEVTVAATGTTLTGRLYWRGWAVSDV